jgi:amidophosphoribosyltransferase
LLQHRGQDSTGIATSDGSHLHQFKTKGQVREAFRTRDMRALPGKLGLGHVRYATAGAAKHEEEAQPFYVNAPYGIVLVHNGNLTNTRELTSDLFSIDRRHVNTSSDTELLLNVLATELQGNIKLKLWHEVTVVPASMQEYEYLNCAPGTGMMPFATAHEATAPVSH